MKIETAKKVYNQAPSWYKEVLEDEFGKEKLIERKFTDINSLEVARIATGETLVYLGFRRDEADDEWAYRMLKMVRDAICQDWEPDWKNTNQKKWTPIINRSAGSGFSGSNCDCECAYTTAGSRLWFETEKQSDHFGRTFIDLIMKF
ncbi:MAG: hypothetical protein WCI31_06205 [Prolixibacteraceae bacterium]